jgi:hypothetical protein
MHNPKGHQMIPPSSVDLPKMQDQSGEVMRIKTARIQKSLTAGVKPESTVSSNQGAFVEEMASTGELLLPPLITNGMESVHPSEAKGPLWTFFDSSFDDSVKQSCRNC